MKSVLGLKPLRCLALVTGVSKSLARTATKLMKLTSIKTTNSGHELQQRDRANRMNFCDWILRSVRDGETEPQLMFFTDEAWFRLHREVSSQKSRYWSSHYVRPTNT
jgi:hypothetical protein